MTGSIESLVPRARSGDRRALEEIFQQFIPRLHRFVAVKVGADNPDIQDLVQETLIAAMEGITRIRSDNEASVAAWLLSIARFKVADYYRHRFARPVDPLEEAPPGDHQAEGVDTEDLVMERARQAEVREALTQLTPEQEEVLTLKFILDYDNESVARITGRTVGAVKSLQHRGLAQMQKLLEGEREHDRA